MGYSPAPCDLLKLDRAKTRQSRARSVLLSVTVEEKFMFHQVHCFQCTEWGIEPVHKLRHPGLLSGFRTCQEHCLMIQVVSFPLLSFLITPRVSFMLVGS